MSERVSTSGDADARRGLLLALVGVALLPATVAAVGTSPRWVRAGVFELGLILTAAVSVWGGALSRRALIAGTHHAGRTFAVTIFSFVVGVTAAIMACWALIGLTL